MKLMILLLSLTMLIGMVWGQDITGDWHGMLDIQGMKLRLVFHISGPGDSLAATFDSPDQGAFGIPVSNVVFSDNQLTMKTDSPPIVYTGELIEDSIEGTFFQSGLELPLTMQREAMNKPVYLRPQEPREPFPYKVEELEFDNREAGIKLSATLTLPEGKGKHPAVILISGSGPQDRNEELVGHKPFWVIADYLTREGIAVLRYDDRGVGASQGSFETATTVDFASDAVSAVKYLKSRKDIGKIGLAGHSEGGIIAPLVAVEMPKQVDFVVLLAGPGIRGDKLLLLQEEMIWRVYETEETEIEKSLKINREVFKIILEENDRDTLSRQINEYLTKSIAEGQIDIPEGYGEKDVIAEFSAEMTNPWMLYFLRHDPAKVLEKLRCPILAMIGSNDLQVPAKENLKAIDAALKKANNKHYTILELPKLNHLFQEAETGHPNEYAKIEQTIAPHALEAMGTWIKKQFRIKSGKQ